MCPVNSEFPLSTGDTIDIINVCNEEAIYDFLFKERFGGEKYREDDAKGFIAWAKKGWQEDEYYVYIVRNAANQIVGCIDIKSNDTKSAEIGYWASVSARGFMTNTILELIKLASKAGFQNLHAFVKPSNHSSANALVRAGFTNLGEVIEKDKEYFKFEFNLVP